jgi:hypothetical protein
VLDKLLCPITCINMHWFYPATLDPEALAAALARLVTRHPFLAGSLVGILSLAHVDLDDSGVEFVVSQPVDRGSAV